eukprot:8414366-Alexandrium_andersonii.AAC.1
MCIRDRDRKKREAKEKADRRKAEKAAEQEKLKQDPRYPAQQWILGLASDVAACMSAKGEAETNEKIALSIREEYKSIFASCVGTIERHRENVQRAMVEEMTPENVSGLSQVLNDAKAAIDDSRAHRKKWSRLK